MLSVNQLTFKVKNKIREVSEHKLLCKDYKMNSSNILTVLDTFGSSLKRK